MTDITRTASDHLLHSTPATFALDAAFVSDMEHARKAGQAVDVIEAHMLKSDREIITNAVKQEIRERMTLTDADIAQMEALCAEQYIDRDCNARMCN